MDFKQYLRLKRLALRSKTLNVFISECIKWDKYGVSLWTKKDYATFYDRIHGGMKYESFRQS